MTFSILAIFKNESHVLREWIDHYKNQGASEIILVNNDSDDDWELKVNDPIVKVYSESGKGIQRKVYSDYYKRCTSKWLLICDLDEFLFARNGFDTVKSYLDSITDDSISAIKVPWTLFNSNGYKKQPPSVVDYFTKRVSYSRKNIVCVKTIVRTDRILHTDVHMQWIKSGRVVDPLLNDCENIRNHSEMKINDEIMSSFPLKMNHYVTQSEEFYWNKKVKRGCVAGQRHIYKRDQKYFDQFINDDDVDDTELMDKKHNKPQTKTKNLVMVSYAGEINIEFDKNPNFDLVVFNYGGNKRFPQKCKYELIVKTECKGDLMHKQIQFLSELKTQYDYICSYDDDVEVTVSDLEKTFKIAHENNLDLFAPSLTPDSQHSHPWTLHKGKGVSKCEWVEVMMPGMSKRFMNEMMPLFLAIFDKCQFKSGWGIDMYLFPYVLEHLKGKCGIIQDVQVAHRRKITSRGRKFSNNLTAWQERDLFKKILRR